MKRILYFIPAIVGCVFYGIMALAFELEPIAFLFLALLILSGIIMYKGKWWGAIFGLGAGVWLMCLDLKATGQIIMQWPIGLVIAVYFIVCGGVLFAKNNKKG